MCKKEKKNRNINKEKLVKKKEKKKKKHILQVFIIWLCVEALFQCLIRLLTLYLSLHVL